MPSKNVGPTKTDRYPISLQRTSIGTDWSNGYWRIWGSAHSTRALTSHYGRWNGSLLNITVIPGTTPTAVHTATQFNHYWKKRLNHYINRDVAMSIIEPIGTPITWCPRMLVAPRKTYGGPTENLSRPLWEWRTIHRLHFNRVSIVPEHTHKPF